MCTRSFEGWFDCDHDSPSSLFWSQYRLQLLLVCSSCERVFGHCLELACAHILDNFQGMPYVVHISAQGQVAGINITVGHRPKSVHLHPVADHFNFCSDIMSDHKNYCLLRVDCYAWHKRAAASAVWRRVVKSGRGRTSNT